MESTIHSIESHFTQVEGMNEEMSIEIVNYFRLNYESGPDFADLKNHLGSMFDFEFGSKFWTQLELIFRESITDGFSTVLNSEGA